MAAMDISTPNAKDPIDELKEAFHRDDALRVRRLLLDHAGLRAKLNEPLGPFNSPAIVNAKSPEMIDALLEAGADLNAKSTWWAGGFGLLHLASPELAAHAIKRGAVVDVHSAARLGLLDRLRVLIADDLALVHARGGDGQTPLHFASTVEIAAFLLDHGADIDARDVDHVSTPAQYMLGDRADVARYLVQRGCATDLLMAAALGNAELVRRHLDADPSCIRLRVSDEFFPMISDKNGGTIYQWTLGWYVSPHEVARKFGHEEIFALLMQRSPPELQLLNACCMGDDDTVRALLGQTPDLVSRLTDSDRRQVAHAARNNETATVRRLLEIGLPVDARSQHLATPLHWAAFQGNLEMANVVLRFNPPLEVKDRDFGGTPLNWAIYGSEHGWHNNASDYPGVVETLIRAGAKLPEQLSGTESVRQVLLASGIKE
jgi:ankyrin repeat protein